MRQAGHQPSERSLDIEHNSGKIAGLQMAIEVFDLARSHAESKIERLRRENRRLSGSNGAAA